MSKRILGNLGARIRDLVERGWSPRDIAAALDVDLERVREFLRQREEPPRRKAPEAWRAAKGPDAWRAAAVADPRYRDRLEPLEPPAAAAIAAELVDQAAAAELPGGPVEPPRPVDPSWGSVYASGPRITTAAVLDEALKLRQEGWSWPAIARKFGCHRMTFYHALRRPPGVGPPTK